MTDQPEVLPCPFCGGRGVIQNEKYTACECGATAPTRIWNHRIATYAPKQIKEEELLPDWILALNRKYVLLADHDSAIRRLTEQRDALRKALEGLLDGLDMNGPEGDYEGLSGDQWQQRITEAKAALHHP